MGGIFRPNLEDLKLDYQDNCTIITHKDGKRIVKPFIISNNMEQLHNDNIGSGIVNLRMTFGFNTQKTKLNIDTTRLEEKANELKAQDSENGNQDKYVYRFARMLSEVHIPEKALDLRSHNAVLNASTRFLMPIIVNHDDWDSFLTLGSVIDTDKDISTDPKGINGLLRFKSDYEDRKRFIDDLGDGTLDSYSSSFKIQWTPSHPKEIEENGLGWFMWYLGAMDENGEQLRQIVTKIPQGIELSVVLAGADKTAIDKGISLSDTMMVSTQLHDDIEDKENDNIDNNIETEVKQLSTITVSKAEAEKFTNDFRRHLDINLSDNKESYELSASIFIGATVLSLRDKEFEIKELAQKIEGLEKDKEEAAKQFDEKLNAKLAEKEEELKKSYMERLKIDKEEDIDDRVKQFDEYHAQLTQEIEAMIMDVYNGDDAKIEEEKKIHEEKVKIGGFTALKSDYDYYKSKTQRTADTELDNPENGNKDKSYVLDIPVDEEY